MSSGGMDWAYRMISAHKLDPLAVAVVLHLGWRDHPDFRTDRGIARALGGRDRRTIRDCTAKLCKLGIIVRRSSQWVAVETVSIVEESPFARVPSAAASDGRGCQTPSPVSLETGGGVRPPPAGVSDPRKRGCETPLKRREKKEKGGCARIAAVPPARSPVARPMGGGSGGSASAERETVSGRPADPWQRAAIAASLGLQWVHPESGLAYAASAFPKGVEKSGSAHADP